MKALLAILAVAAATAGMKPVSISLPAWNSELKDGPNVALARASCLTCHSAEYVYMQPPLSAKQWTAEVNKMVKVFGAPITADQVDPLVAYLMSQNGH